MAEEWELLVAKWIDHLLEIVIDGTGWIATISSTLLLGKKVKRNATIFVYYI